MPTTPAELASDYLAPERLVVAHVDEMIAHATARLLAAQTDPREFQGRSSRHVSC